MTMVNIDNRINKEALEVSLSAITTIFESANLNNISSKNVGKALDLIKSTHTQGNVAISGCEFTNHAPKEGDNCLRFDTGEFDDSKGEV